MPCNGCSTLHGVNPNFNSKKLDCEEIFHIKVYSQTYIYMAKYKGLTLRDKTSNTSWQIAFQTSIFVFINQPEAWWWE